MLRTDPRVHVVMHQELEQRGRVMGAWQLKAYGARDLMRGGGYDLLLGFDSDLVFVSNVEDIMRDAIRTGMFHGGMDGEGATYGSEYAVYGIKTPIAMAPYMSTSCYFCPRTSVNLEILDDWAHKTDDAQYGPNGGIYPGHGDQGVLNAVIYAKTKAHNVCLLPNELWSQHWLYEEDWIEWVDSVGLVNRSRGCCQMRTLHCGGSDKFWSKAHSEKRHRDGTGQRWSYAMFLRFLHLGKLSVWDRDPAEVIPDENDHVYHDAILYHQLIQELEPDFREKWSHIGWRWLNRLMVSCDQHRMMTLCGDGSMDTYLRLGRCLPPHSSIVEVGSYLGGSVATLAVGLLGQHHRITSVESLSGNADNTVDGYPVPSVDAYLSSIKKKWGMLNIDAIQLPSALAAHYFQDGSLDFVFLDGDHSESAVERDILSALLTFVWVPEIGGRDCGVSLARAAA